MVSAPRSDPLVKTYEGCHWEPDPLNRIATLFRGQAELTEVVFSTRLKTYTFSEKTLRALRTAINNSPVPGDRDRVENLTISATGPGHCVSLVIDDRVSTYRVEGENSTWNNGIAHQMDEWAAHVGGQETRKRRRHIYPVLAGVVLIGLAVLGLMTGALPRSPGALTITVTMVLVGIAAAYLNAGVWGRRRRTRFNPFGKLPPLGWWAAMTRPERITTVSAVIAGLAWLTTLTGVLSNLR